MFSCFYNGSLEFCNGSQLKQAKSFLIKNIYLRLAVRNYVECEIMFFLDYFQKRMTSSQKKNKECANVSKFEWVWIDYTFVRDNISIVRKM